MSDYYGWDEEKMAEEFCDYFSDIGLNAKKISELAQKLANLACNQAGCCFDDTDIEKIRVLVNQIQENISEAKESIEEVSDEYDEFCEQNEEPYDTTQEACLREYGAYSRV